jgi:hypothetical protein
MPGHITVAVASYSRQVVVGGLTDGQAYTFTLTATNAVGTSQPSIPSAPAVPSPVQPLSAPAGAAPAGAATTAAVPFSPSSALGSATRPTAAGSAKPPAGPCIPMAQAAATAGGMSTTDATTAVYQDGSHRVTVMKPPSGLDLGTASLATLHKYGYVLDITTDTALAAWRHLIGHSHPVAVTPCIAPHHGSGQALSGSGCSSTSTASFNSTLYNWAGIEADAPASPPADPATAVMDTGNAFQTVQGRWIQGTFTPRPGGENSESSWVGIGGDRLDSHAPTQELIQAGTGQQDAQNPVFWIEALGSYDDTGMVEASGISVHPGDNVFVQVSVFDPAKNQPRLNPVGQFGDTSSYATFNFYDNTTGQSSPTLYVGNGDGGVWGQYDGTTAEWIDEAVTLSGPCWSFPSFHCSEIAVMPKFSSIRWTYADATATFNPVSGTGDGPPGDFAWHTITMIDRSGKPIVQPEQITNIGNSAASWYDVFVG